MTKNDLLNRAIEIAARAHTGQKRFGNGESYILHPLRVMMSLNDIDEKIVAVLHDVVEDTNEKSETNWTIEILKEEGFHKAHLDAIEAITKVDDDEYEDYLQRVKKNKIARNVKVADIEDNMNIFSLKKVKQKDMIRLEKYHAARLYLMSD